MACLWIAAAFLASLAVGAPSPSALKSDITLLVDNDLTGPSSPQAKAGVLILDAPHSVDDAPAACAAIGEDLWSPVDGVSIQPLLNFLSYNDKTAIASAFWAKNGTVTAQGIVGKGRGNAMLPVLCTHTAPYSNNSFQDTSSQWQVSVDANGETLTGYRDHLSFRFLGIRYAPQPERFTYSEMYKGSGGNVSALKFGSQCVQGGGGSEDCLFLNVWTPMLPAADSKAPLKPVMFWIHGGAYTGGTGSDSTFDGGNIVSRGDVVMVAINYRLTTLGFLALPDGKTNGNFGLADQIVALDWVRKNIKAFGGDPDRITVFGQSAGAGSVRAMMASPKAKGKFAAAIPMSNLGGLAYGTTYSKYYTIPEEMTVAGNAILAATNCTNATSQVDCLRAVPATTLAGLSTVARYIVVDGKYITTPQLELNGTDVKPASYSLMMGTMAEDGLPFISYTRDIEPSAQSSWLSSQGLPANPPASLYPLEQIANQTLAVDRVGARLATDAIFRCIDEATVYAGLQTGALGDKVWYYEFDRAYQTNGWPALNLCEPAPDADHPNGDPETPQGYSRCHSGELLYVFGNLARMGRPFRDDRDLPFSQYILDVFASFARAHDPNPDHDFLSLRGYKNTLDLLDRTGTWSPSVKGKMQTRILDWPGANHTEFVGAADLKNMMSDFRDVDQCKWLGLGLDYYL